MSTRQRARVRERKRSDSGSASPPLPTCLSVDVALSTDTDVWSSWTSSDRSGYRQPSDRHLIVHVCVCPTHMCSRQLPLVPANPNPSTLDCCLFGRPFPRTIIKPNH